MRDFDLLQEYGARGSEQAFATLVNQYTDLVYSAALRQSGDAHVAQEITQAVFAILARKAGTLRPPVVLSGWLLRTTRFVALNARRRELRRRQAELKAAIEAASMYQTETAHAWEQIAPVLDEGLAGLSESDRNALALRFFEGKSFKQIGEITGTSDDTAQKRVSRALEKLRANFTEHGVKLSVAVIAVTVSSKAVQAAPAQLATTLSHSAISVATASGPISNLMDLGMRSLRAAQLRKYMFRAAEMFLVLLLLFIATNQIWNRLLASRQSSGKSQTTVEATEPLSRPPGVPAAIAAADFGQMLLHVTDAQSGGPVALARVSCIWDMGLPDSFTNVLTTDSQGNCRISFVSEPVEDLWSLRLEILRDGYIPKLLSWSAARGDAFEEIPPEYATRLERGSVIGGIVVDDRGEPVAGARLVVSKAEGTGTGGVSPLREGTAMTHSEMTDGQGHWMCNHVPPGLDLISLVVFHPEFIPANFRPAKLGALTNLGVIYVLEQDLRNQTALMAIHHGLTVRGIVIDSEGNPVGGAKVTENHLWASPDENLRTDQNGRFEFANAAEGQMKLTIRADGFQVMDLSVQPQEPREWQIQLSKGGILRGQVIDEKGNPLNHAGV